MMRLQSGCLGFIGQQEDKQAVSTRLHRMGSMHASAGSGPAIPRLLGVSSQLTAAPGPPHSALRVCNLNAHSDQHNRLSA